MGALVVSEDGKAQQLTGRQGSGESLQQSLTSAGDSSKSNRGYKELYEAMAPAAQILALAAVPNALCEVA